MTLPADIAALLPRPIVIIADPGREQEAALRLGRIGFDHVRGSCGN